VSPPQPVPPLENGDCLTRYEFERRYDAMPELKKAELIEGLVYMPSPVRAKQHGNPHNDLSTWLGLYRWDTPGVWVADNSTVRLDLDNEPQPDIAVYLDPQLGGQVVIGPDGYIEGAPEMVVEVTASTVSIDLGPKMHVYRRSGVREYVVWRVQDGALDWFVLRQGQYDRPAPDAVGVYRSEVFPGLWLAASALLAGNLVQVRQTLQQGLASPEHTQFVALLQQRAPAGS
jgi:hypothetical protein